MKHLIFLCIFVFVLFSCTSMSNDDNNIIVEKYNTRIVINGDIYENNIDPERNKVILPYILDEDKNDLIAGGSKISLTANSFVYEDNILIELTKRGFEPDLYVYYSNDTKQTDNIVIYENKKIIFYARYSYYIFSEHQ